MVEINVSPEKSSSNYKTAGYAPAYSIPSMAFVEIEHPCIIKNIDKGVQSLGGTSQLEMVGYP